MRGMYFAGEMLSVYLGSRYIRGAAVEPGHLLGFFSVGATGFKFMEGINISRYLIGEVMQNNAHQIS